MRLAFDLESDGLLDSVTKVHSLCVRDVDDNTQWSFIESGIDGALGMLFQANELIGHNIISFDLPVLKKLYGWEPKPACKITDTLVISRLIYSDIDQSDYIMLRKNPQWLPGKLVGRHSLKSWGYRLGILKGDFGEQTDWKNWSPEMQAYCEQDVVVTTELFKKFEGLNYSKVAIQLETEFQQVIHLLEQYGFAFDEKAANVLWAKLVKRQATLTVELQKVFPPTIEVLKKPAYYTVGEGRFSTKGAAKKFYGNKCIIVDGPPAEKVHPFNPGSRLQVATVLKNLGWKPTKFTPSGAAQVDEAVLDEVLEDLKVPEAALLNEYMVVQKRLGQLSEGGKCWLKSVKNGRLHQGVTTNGAVTGRCTHRLIVNVPKALPNVPYGIEMRSLFIADPGMILVGADASGLELRCLGAYMAPYDGGEYAREVVEGDVHMRNTVALGLAPTKENRNMIAKTWVYAYLYGAGDEKLGKIQGVTPEEIALYKSTEKKRWTAAKTRLTKDNRESDDKTVAIMVKGAIQRSLFEEGTPALKLLKAAILLKVEQPTDWNQWKLHAAKAALEDAGHPVPKYTGFLRGIDGRLLRVRSSHSALNTLLQSAGALLCKKATILQYQKLIAKGYTFGEDFAMMGTFHDEIQVQCRPELTEEVGLAFVHGIKEAGEAFSFQCPLTGEYSTGKNWADTH